MSKKFTEEQYQKIVETVNKYPDFGSVYYVQNGWVESKPTNTFNELIEALSYTVSGESEVNRMLALANPLTREWAHERFVEKEQEFHFILKNMQGSQKIGRHHLVRSGRGAIIIYPFAGSDKPKFKESEIKAWGYNPEMFDKEEV